ncbi:MAG: HAMP domain-containing histidine kinase [Oligoflexia bacterium]|jgi:signal transduction histidine kinase|nr:HAMP domain-containing histidine kinase [Bacteroidota bacterium]MCP4914907.1 HAMP domain-containing histidine kinase [Oligoflexia bacterium]
MKETSIVDYAQQTANRLALRFRAIGLLIGLVLAIVYSVYHHFSVADTVLNVAKTNLAQSIQIGGTYYQARLASSMIKTDVFEHVWIFDSNKELIIREGNNVDNISPKSLWERRFYTKDFWPYALIKSKVSYHGEHTGTLFVSYRLPLIKSFVILTLITAIFLMLSYYIKTRILNMGQNIASPVFAFMTTLEESLRDNKFANKKKGRSFKELVKFETWLRDFFIQAKKSEKVARKALADAQTAKIASQVRHDIQGALMIANSALNNINEHNDEVRILKASLDRVKSTIQDIPKIANLDDKDIEGIVELQENKNDEESLENCHLLSIVTQVVSDLSLTNNNISFNYELSNESEKAYIKTNYKRFERVLFNLYKNAVEAIDSNGTITTKVSLNDESVLLEIEDSGKGIPDNILKKLGQKGISYGKAHGTGLGVYDAFEQFDKWVAGIDYSTLEGKGTTVTMRFDAVEENPLFPSEILIAENSTVVILDDDPSVHESWKQRFKELSNDGVTYKYFESPELAKIEINSLKNNNREFLFLGDYDLRNKSIDGIKFIRENDLSEYSILVTSSIDSVLDDCRKLEIPVISKSIQSTIDIHTIR